MKIESLNDNPSGYTPEQHAVFDWAASHGFTPVTSEINDLLDALKTSEIPVFTQEYVDALIVQRFADGKRLGVIETEDRLRKPCVYTQATGDK